MEGQPGLGRVSGGSRQFLVEWTLAGTGGALAFRAISRNAIRRNTMEKLSRNSGASVRSE